MRLISAVFAFAALVLTAHAAPAQSPPHVTVVGIGDSLLTGSGLFKEAQLLNLLQRHLDEAGHDVTIVDTGFLHTSASSGYWLEHPTTREGKPFVWPLNSAAIIELGGNDCLHGLDIHQTTAHLDHLVQTLSQMGVDVLLVGTAAFDECGADYVRQFAQLYADLAAKYGTLLYPEFKAGILGQPDMFQDLDHPNEAGEAIVAANMLPIVVELIERAAR